MKFELHTVDSAPQEVKDELAAAQAMYGSIPNLYRGLANAPAALKLYLDFNETMKEFAYLTQVEQQVVYLTISTENGCTYCVGAHSTLANMAQIPAETLEELRQQSSLTDAKFNALRNFALALMESRGWVSETQLTEFQNAGYDQRHVLEVITLLAQKTMSNYFNHIAQTPLDEMFQATSWEASK